MEKKSKYSKVFGTIEKQVSLNKDYVALRVVYTDVFDDYHTIVVKANKNRNWYYRNESDEVVTSTLEQYLKSYDASKRIWLYLSNDFGWLQYIKT